MSIPSTGQNEEKKASRQKDGKSDFDKSSEMTVEESLNVLKRAKKMVQDDLLEDDYIEKHKVMHKKQKRNSRENDKEIKPVRKRNVLKRMLRVKKENNKEILKEI